MRPSERVYLLMELSPNQKVKGTSLSKKRLTKDMGIKKCQWVAGAPGKGYSSPSSGKQQTKRKGTLRPDGAVTEGFCISWACFESTKMTWSDFNLYIKNLQMMKNRKNHLLGVEEERVFRKRRKSKKYMVLLQAG